MATDCAPSANNDLLGQLIEFCGARSRAADSYGQFADLGEQRVRRLVEIQGMTNDLDACAPDDVACRLLVAASVNQVASTQAEDRAVSEELVKVGVGVAARFLRLVLQSLFHAECLIAVYRVRAGSRLA